MTIRTLPVYDPIAELDRFNSLFDTFFPIKGRSSVPQGAVLPLDVFEKEGRVVIRASVPGLSPDDLEVSIEGGVLTLTGTLSFDEEHKDAKVYRREIATGTFSRSIRLPDDIDAERVEATFSNGLVTVTLPRTVETKSNAVRIPVKDARGG